MYNTYDWSLYPQLFYCIAIGVSNLVTAVLVSLISVFITSIVMYLIMKRSNRPKQQVNSEAKTTTVIYDLPNINHEYIDSKATIQDNVAYGVMK